MLKLRRIIRRLPSSRELKRLESVGKPVERSFDSEDLRIVAFSDYRVQDISLLQDFVKELQPRHPQLTPEEVLADLIQRDTRDSSRKIGVRLHGAEACVMKPVTSEGLRRIAAHP